MRRVARLCPIALIASLLCGCGGGGERPASTGDRTATKQARKQEKAAARSSRRAEKTASKLSAASDWRSLATENDRRRLRTWREAWTQVLQKLASDPRIAAEGTLLQPDSALAGVTPPPGAYRCRVIKLGAQDSAMPDYTPYPSFICRIAPNGALLALAKTTGSQRPTGILYPDGDQRFIFLGTMVLGDETVPRIYGRDPERDMVGLFERIGPQRWRLVLPYPRWESTLDVMELVPVG